MYPKFGLSLYILYKSVEEKKGRKIQSYQMPTCVSF